MSTQTNLIETPESVVTPETAQEALVEMTEVVGRKWHPVILQLLGARGTMGFNDLKEEINHISSKVLADSLDRLESRHELVERRVVNEKPVRVEYALTDRGRDLEPVVTAMRDWGLEHL
ncbi:MAG: winged helix-turn-helix transcriptional regulator [Halobacteriaceae archaeon]